MRRSKPPRPKNNDMNDEKREAANPDNLVAIGLFDETRKLFEETGYPDPGDWDYFIEGYNGGFDRGYDAGLAAASQWKVIETDGLPEESCGCFLTVRGLATGNVFSGEGYFAKQFGSDGWMGIDNKPLAGKVEVIAYIVKQIPTPFTKGETEE